jgi:glycosyltransferase involved in cell wall biosynthesis
VIEAVGVVVPAHDEEELLPACLNGLAAAAAVAIGERPGLRVRIVVAADACTDGTVAVARRAGVAVAPLAARNVGVARAVGLDTLLRPGTPAWDDGPTPAGGPPPAPDALWLATTDADSVVPAHWLSGQLRQAEAGWDAVVGTVTVADWAGYPAATAREFSRRYGTWQNWHPHVHGANLGFTAAAYQAVGGFPARRTGEDRALVASLQARGFRVLRSAAVSVVTSARVRYRAPAGFGHDLATLNDGGEPLLDLRGGVAGV